jgi:hypothetical protein
VLNPWSAKNSWFPAVAQCKKRAFEFENLGEFAARFETKLGYEPADLDWSVLLMKITRCL